MLKEFLFVGAGGALGSMARYLLSSIVLAGATLWGFPLGTFTVNVIGSLFIGLFMGILRDGSTLQWLLITGFCGGFTTFSTFSADFFKLLRMERWEAAILYVLCSVAIALVATMLGWWIGTTLKN